ncbi:MAG: fibrobacter succinogenes major paralogous domain-containing protein [Dysgonamonadaceae bacterium]|jgi:hypothetical protein|nr:fibrobacter succinogenes major paralogous domain-containing protein [Dysgonamonadaceae bacterium]
MKRKMMFLALMLLMLSTASVNAQVVIGSEADPHDGAVLDLQSTTQGFKLPTVSLADVITFGLAGDVGTATGMMVYNTNASIKDGNGKGIYIWNGKKWNVVNTDNSEDTNEGSATAKIGDNMYKIYTYPYDVGTWMLENSKEGTPSATTYTGRAEGERGYYYTFEQAPEACPNTDGWYLPNPTEWRGLATYLNAHTSSPTAWPYWLDWGIYAGRCANIAKSEFSHWSNIVWYYTTVENVLFVGGEGRLERQDNNTWTGGAYPVRCIKR